MHWSPEQYVAFEVERTRAVRDLLGSLRDIDARAVIDLGCGPGNSTHELLARYPTATIAALDSSPQMIATARERLPRVRFEVEHIAAWVGREGAAVGGPFDVILANAVLHWLPDHATLLAELAAKLAPGGALAVQMPDSLHEPAARLMRETAARGPWANTLAHVAALRTELESAERYHAILTAAGCEADVWRTTYYHRLPAGIDGIIEWFKGSGLRPFLEPLDEGERRAYLREYGEALAHAYSVQTDGAVLLPFPRLFMVGYRGDARRRARADVP